MAKLVTCSEQPGFLLPARSSQGRAASQAIGEASSHTNARAVRRFELRNAAGLVVELVSLGATLHSVRLPGEDGRSAGVGDIEITRGLADLAQYADNAAYMGAICGRYAGRIANSRFVHAGKEHRLTPNDGPHHLHGGDCGFDAQLWEASVFGAQSRSGDVDSADALAGVHFSYLSPAGEEGYPGALRCRVSYSLDARSRLRIDYTARASGHATPVNLTNHCYWNLSGKNHVLGHELELAAADVLEFDASLLPTGVRLPVVGTALDFSRRQNIGEALTKLPDGAAGFDHCFVLTRNDHGSHDDGRTALGFVGQLADPSSGRSMRVFSDQAALVLYTGNYLNGAANVGGHPQHAGLCLECQQIPDASNRPDFPNTVLQAGETYRQTTVYAFEW